MKKSAIFILLAVLAKIGCGLSCLWAIISFLIYLVKNQPFDWWSVWSIGINLVGMFLFIFLGLMSSWAEARKQAKEEASKPSKWQQRID